MPRKREPYEFIVDEATGCFNVVNVKKTIRDVNRRSLSIQKFIYEQCFGEVPDGKIVIRKCGNNKCINPEHLALTTVEERGAQMAKKYLARPLEFEVDPVTGCHNCISHPLDSAGYHRIQVNNKLYLAHRYVYEKEYGKIPEGYVVRHKCDNPHCINPAHLELGTQYDNIQDMVNRGRIVKGSRKGNAKLTEEVVREIKKRLAAGDGVSYLARIYGVSHSIISEIKTGKAWRHVD